MRHLKAVFGIICLVVLVSNIWSMSRWSEARGVYDDICYLRQAHLFQRFGVNGLNTDMSREDDGFLSGKLKEIRYPTWNDVSTAPCHNVTPGTGKRVLQYPPGTGFLLSLFPEGRQVVPLYVCATVIVFGFAIFGILYARSATATALAGIMGAIAIYMMINPAKASYSMAPTLAACALAGFLTARWFAGPERKNAMLLTILTGLVLGMSVNFRLPNLFLSSGYFLFFLVSFLSFRKFEIVVRGTCFTAAFVAGLVPTLVTNAINAGSPFATTYGGPDVVAPELSRSIIWQYLADFQFVLIVAAAGATLYILRNRNQNGVRRVALVTAANLIVNLAFFVSHPIFTPYYTVPVAMLSLWSLVFASVMEPAEEVDDMLVNRAARA
jgi:hypothetical protein